MKVETAVLGSPSLIVFMVSVDIKKIFKKSFNLNVRVSELRSCVKVETAVQGSQSLTSLMVSVHVKQN